MRARALSSIHRLAIPSDAFARVDPSTLRTRLTGDGALALIVDDDVQDLVSAWLPRHLTLAKSPAAKASSQRRASGAVIRVRRTTVLRDLDAPHDGGTPRAPVVATFGPVSIRPLDVGLALDDNTATTRGRVDYSSMTADLEIAGGAPSDVVALHAMLTIAAAALLVRLGRALVHAAAIVAPDGGGWLLAGDSHAGKSTTCATLLDAGWRYCSDDHVVVSAAGAPGDQVHVEGWPRILHLDHGWDGGAPQGGLRASVDSFERWPGYWQPSARILGVLLPTVDRAADTRLLPCTAAVRLSALIRQSPWLFADTIAAPAALDLLRRVALLPGAALRLGHDSFHKPVRLQEVLSPLIGLRTHPVMQPPRNDRGRASEQQRSPKQR